MAGRGEAFGLDGAALAIQRQHGDDLGRVQRHAHGAAPGLDVAVLDRLWDAALGMLALGVELAEGAPYRVGARWTGRADQLSRSTAGLPLRRRKMLAAGAAVLETLAQPELVAAMGAEGVEPAKGKKLPLTLRKAIAALRSQRSPVAL